MTQNLKEARVEHEIPFHDVDSYRVVWHGNYPRYFEIARCRLLDQLKVSYAEMERMGYFFPVIDLQAKYLKPLVFGQRVWLKATLHAWHHKLTIRYQIIDCESGAIHTKGETSQVAVSPEGLIQYDAPKVFVDTIEKSLASQAD